ncbi:MAG: transposase [Clostridia bacterium]|nr:transposase [Clostridia bacterium]
MLKEAANAPESFKTARLFKRGQDYYLALTLAWGAETPIPVKTFMGISRGIKNRLYYTVVDQNGLVMAHGAGDSIRSDESAKKQRLSEPGGESLSQQELHIITNSLVKLALKYESQVILQNLAHKGDRLSLVPGHGVLSTGLRRREYNQLVRLLAYKLPWKGLPDPVKVSSVDIFITCPQCGLATKSNRLRSDFFICTRCGTAMETDKLGGVNLARKLIRYHQSKVKIKAERVEGGVRFTHRLMGLDIVAGNYENPLDKLKREIERILAAAAFESVAERGKKAIEGLEEQVSDEPDSHNRITHSVSGATADKDFCAIPESPLESVEKAHDVMDDQTLALRRSLFKKFMSVDNFMDLLEYV